MLTLRTDADVNAGVDLVLTIEIRSVSESESLSPGKAVLLLSVVLIDVLEEPRRGGLRNDLVLKLSDSIADADFDVLCKLGLPSINFIPSISCVSSV